MHFSAMKGQFYRLFPPFFFTESRFLKFNTYFVQFAFYSNNIYLKLKRSCEKIAEITERKYDLLIDNGGSINPIRKAVGNKDNFRAVCGSRSMMNGRDHIE